VTVVDDLRDYGLVVEGDPATVPVRVAGAALRVGVEESDAAVTLRAWFGAPAAGRLPGAVLSAAGMTSTGVELVGMRSLPAGDAPATYDAVFELAKALVQMARLAEQWAAAGYELEVAAPEGPPGPGSRPPSAPPPVPRWWGSVLVDTPIVSGDAARRPVSTLRPGQWYAVLDEQGGWLLVDDGAGVRGWLGETQLRRST
jgi:hypothetical protein